MKIVLDTNVIVSGLLSPFGPAGQIMRQVASGDFIICYDARILTEYRNVLEREKFPFDSDLIEDLMMQIKSTGELTASKPLTQRLPDKDDEPFLEVTLSGNAEYLVTGNLKHYPTEKQANIRILSPAGFLEVYRKLK